MNSVATVTNDSIGSKNFTGNCNTASTGGMNGNYCTWYESSYYMTRSALVTGSFSCTGWVKPEYLVSGSNLEILRLQYDATHYIKLTVNDASSADGYYDFGLSYVDGATTNTQNFTSPDDSWTFFAIVADMGTSIVGQINDSVTTDTTNHPNIANAFEARVNVGSTHGDLQDRINLDELYFWETDILTSDERTFLRNGGTGRFHPW